MQALRSGPQESGHADLGVLGLEGDVEQRLPGRAWNAPEVLARLNWAPACRHPDLP